MPKELPRALRNELEWAVGVITAHGSPEPHQLTTIRAAVNHGSSMLHKRFAQFYDNAAPYSDEMTRTDCMRIGSLMIALEAHAKGEPWHLYQPFDFEGDDGDKRTTQIQFRCSDLWKTRLQFYCERSGQQLSDVIRKAVDQHLAGNPLWANAAEDEEPEDEEA